MRVMSLILTLLLLSPLLSVADSTDSTPPSVGAMDKPGGDTGGRIIGKSLQSIYSGASTSGYRVSWPYLLQKRHDGAWVHIQVNGSKYGNISNGEMCYFRTGYDDWTDTCWRLSIEGVYVRTVSGEHIHGKANTSFQPWVK